MSDILLAPSTFYYLYDSNFGQSLFYVVVP